MKTSSEVAKGARYGHAQILIDTAYFFDCAVAGCLNVYLTLRHSCYKETLIRSQVWQRNREADAVDTFLRTLYGCGLARFPWSFQSCAANQHAHICSMMTRSPLYIQPQTRQL